MNNKKHGRSRRITTYTILCIEHIITKKTSQTEMFSTLFSSVLNMTTTTTTLNIHTRNNNHEDIILCSVLLVVPSLRRENYIASSDTHHLIFDLLPDLSDTTLSSTPFMLRRVYVLYSLFSYPVDWLSGIYFPSVPLRSTILGRLLWGQNFVVRTLIW